MLTEINIDALVGPTHHFGGLGVGNIASIEHQQRTSYPKLAALEGVAKAALVARLGIPQFILLPPVRPKLELLNRLGFKGTNSERLAAALHAAPRALSAVFSSAFMWAANAATVTPAVDSSDNRYHITPANLISSWHRASEAHERALQLQELFANIANLQIHAPLPSIVPVRDEGAANHMRLCDPSGILGFNVFVFGEDDSGNQPPSKFLARQTRAASAAIARSHGLDPETTFFFRQHPDAISAGVFHNDVIATSHQGLLIHHQLAFIEADAELQRLETTFLARTGQPLIRIEVGKADITLSDAVQSYFFNSQILTSPTSGRMTLVCPLQCQRHEAVRQFVEQLIADPLNPIEAVHFVSLDQSMANGGGPACLRLRLPVDRLVLEGMNSRLRMGSELEERLTAAIDRLYPDRIEQDDLIDPDFVAAAEHAALELQRIFITEP